MICRNVLPTPALRQYVQYFSVLHFEFDPYTPLPFKPYPAKPEQCLSFYPRDAENVEYLPSGIIRTRYRSCLIGQHSQGTNRYIDRDFMLIQVFFHPGVVFRLTGIPQGELVNTFIDAEAVWGNPMRELNQRLAATNEYGLMVTFIERFLLDLVQKAKRPAHPIDGVTELIARQPGRFSLDELSQQACLSPSQLERTFIQRTGVTPKLLSRIARFEQVVQLKDQCPTLDWLSIALQCGYYDYQHLVKDFKEFAGGTPPAFWIQESRAPERHFSPLDRRAYPLDTLE